MIGTGTGNRCYGYRITRSFSDHFLSWDFLAEHVFLLMVLEVVTGPLHVHEHAVATPDVNQVDLPSLPAGSQQRTSGDQLDGIPKSGVHSDLGQELEALFGQLHILLLAAGLDNLPDLLLGVVLGLDDEQTVQQIQRHAVGTE